MALDPEHHRAFLVCEENKPDDRFSISTNHANHFSLEQAIIPRPPVAGCIEDLESGLAQTSALDAAGFARGPWQQRLAAVSPKIILDVSLQLYSAFGDVLSSCYSIRYRIAECGYKYAIAVDHQNPAMTCSSSGTGDGSD